MLTPNGGENLVGDQVTVTWTASDTDGDPLSFSVQYSPDNGSSWILVAQGITGSSITIQRPNLAGSTQGLVRVWASDGIHASSDTSDGVFTLPNQLPTVQILAPMGRITTTISQTLGLSGQAYDPDTGTLTGALLTWTSNLDGLLGIGRQLSVIGLSAGTHTITFSADDGQGAIVSDTVQVIVVGNLGLLPPVPDGLSAGPAVIRFDAGIGRSEATVFIDNVNVQSVISWTLAFTETWLQASALSGSTPDAITLTLLSSGLSPGTHQANLSFTSPDLPGEVAVIRVEAFVPPNRVLLPLIWR